jgi:predicted CoA-binding protein
MSADGVALLRDARSILLIDWPSRDVPDSLARAGLRVVVEGAPGRYDKFVLSHGEVEVVPVDGPPPVVDIVYAHRPIGELPDIVEQARKLGATAVWLQSGLDRPAETEASRRIVESAGLTYIDKPYIADVAALLGRLTEHT